MSRYIDADALLMEIDMNEDLSAYDAVVFYEMVDDQPTADVVEVVRCKDCRFWQSDWETSHDGYHYCSMIDVVIDGDFYCKDGERIILPKD